MVVTFEKCFNNSDFILMEGALSERLKREFNIFPNSEIALAAHVYNKHSSEKLLSLFTQYINIAKKFELPIMITTPTRRANKERVLSSHFKNNNVIKDNVDKLLQLKRDKFTPVYVGGLMGCYGDAYNPNKALSVEESFKLHSWQADLFAKANVDFLFAGIMPALSESLGMAKSMEETSLPYIISFMIGKNGRLLDGTSINDAIEAIDDSTKATPLCYMTNCVHPQILYSALSHDFNKTDVVRRRFKGIQANTSSLPPEELDNCCELKTSDCVALTRDMMNLQQKFNLKIFGGCCGTDNTHIESIARELRALGGKNND